MRLVAGCSRHSRTCRWPGTSGSGVIAPANALGVSAQAVWHVGVPVGTSIDFQLYRNDPDLYQRFFLPEQYPGGLSYSISLEGAYAFYLFTLGVFLLAALAVWNLSRSKTGRVVRAIRNSEIAASTSGVNLTAWKLAAFGVSAGLAGLAGGLLAPAIGSVSAGAYTLQQSLAVVAIAIVVGVRSVGAAAVGGIFLIFGPELLTHTPLSTLWFPLIVGSILIFQVILTPQGVVPDWQERFRRRFPPAPRFPDRSEPTTESQPDAAAAEAPTLVKVS